jgi:hypothetical protein
MSMNFFAAHKNLFSAPNGGKPQQYERLPEPGRIAAAHNRGETAD